MAHLGPFKFISPYAAALTGTLTASVTEADIVTGGKTLIITLTGATWAAAGAPFDAVRQAIIDGLDSAEAEATGWDALVRPAIAVTDVVRTSDTVVTITLPAVATYDITADETITATIPASATSAAVPIVAAPTVSIAAATAAYQLQIVAVPDDVTQARGIYIDADYEVDWGDGVFVSYLAGTNSAIPSGTITIRSAASPTTFRFQTSGVARTWTSITVSVADSITSLNSAFSGQLSPVITLPSLPLVAAAVSMMANNTAITSFSMPAAPLLTTLQTAFSGCTNLATVAFSTLGSLLNMTSTFMNCSALTTVASMDTSTVTNMSQTFRNCGLITGPAMNTASVQQFFLTFYNCANLVSVPAYSTASATDFRAMFAECSSLRCIAALDTTTVAGTTMKQQMFYGCRVLKHPLVVDALGNTEAGLMVSAAGYAYVNSSPGDCADFYATGGLFGLFDASGEVKPIYRYPAGTEPTSPPAISSIVFPWEDQVFTVTAWTDGGGGFYSAKFVGFESHPDLHLEYVYSPGIGVFQISSEAALGVVPFSSLIGVGIAGGQAVKINLA
jgi:hypothetical protein